MKYLISKGNYARVTAGMTPPERADVDALVSLYPDLADGGRPVIRVDQDRIAARLAELMRDQPPPARLPCGMGDAPWIDLAEVITDLYDEEREKHAEYFRRLYLNNVVEAEGRPGAPHATGPA